MVGEGAWKKYPQTLEPLPKSNLAILINGLKNGHVL